MLSLNHFGRAVARAMSPEPKFLRNVLAIQKRSQCKHEGDNAAAAKNYDEQDSQFTDQELNLFKKLFMKYDRDENCKLDRWEFNQFAKFLVGRSYNSIDLEKVFSKIDKNKDGFISWSETVVYLKKRHVEMILDRAYDVFGSVDSDGDGLLQYWEAKMALGRLGKDTTSPFLRHIFAATDRDKDLKINFQEFAQFMSEVFERYDNNKDNFVDFPELMKYLAKRFRPQSMKRVAIAFNLFDKNNDAMLEFWEAKQALFYLGENITAKCLRYEFDTEDDDQDGKLIFDQFVDLICALRKRDPLICKKNVDCGQKAPECPPPVKGIYKGN